MSKIGILALANKKNGGVFQYTQALIDALNEDKENIYIIFSNKDFVEFDTYNFEIRKFEIPKKYVLLSILRYILSYLGLKPSFIKKEIGQNFQDIDLFITPTITLYPHYFLNKPFLFTLHDLQEKYLPSNFSFEQRLLRHFFNKVACKNATSILCESNYVKQDIHNFFKADLNKIHVIPAPPSSIFLNIEISKDKTQEVIKKYNLPKKYLFYPAQFWHHKNHLNLIQAFSLIKQKYPDLSLVLTGSKQNNYEAVLDKISNLGLTDSIKILGYIDSAGLPILYKQAVMLVMPTLFESISIPIYEAFAIETPVCCSNVVALPEQVGKAGITFNPSDPEDIAEKITIILSDLKLQQKLKTEGKKIMANNSPKSYSKKIILTVNQVLK